MIESYYKAMYLEIQIIVPVLYYCSSLGCCCCYWMNCRWTFAQRFASDRPILAYLLHCYDTIQDRDPFARSIGRCSPSTPLCSTEHRICHSASTNIKDINIMRRLRI